MGLLDILGSSMDDPKTAATLQLAQGLLSSPRLMQGLASGLQGYQGSLSNSKKELEMQRLRKMQMEEQEMQLATMKRTAAQAALQERFRASIPSPQMAGVQQALSGGGGPTMANAAQIPQVDPNAQLMHGALRAGLVDPVAYINSQRKDTAPVKLGAGESLLDPKTFKPLATNPKEDTTPSAVREYNFAKAQGYPGSFLDFQLAQKRAGASSVSVNTGQKGFDNTLKLRSDFRSEPIYKAQQEMQSAYSQIQQGLKQGTPAGDLAGATKLMKLLDPGSVVRESELGMAMAATGLLDRAQNYASMVISGNKLTPKQRVEFKQLADALANESSKAYDAKRSEYTEIADRNQLNAIDVVGPKATPQKTVARTGRDAQGRKVIQYSDGSIEHAD